MQSLSAFVSRSSFAKQDILETIVNDAFVDLATEYTNDRIFLSTLPRLAPVSVRYSFSANEDYPSDTPDNEYYTLNDVSSTNYDNQLITDLSSLNDDKRLITDGGTKSLAIFEPIFNRRMLRKSFKPSRKDDVSSDFTEHPPYQENGLQRKASHVKTNLELVQPKQLHYNRNPRYHQMANVVKPTKTQHSTIGESNRSTLLPHTVCELSKRNKNTKVV